MFETNLRCRFRDKALRTIRGAPKSSAAATKPENLGLGGIDTRIATATGLRCIQDLNRHFRPEKDSPMKKVPKPTTDADLIQQFLDNGGSITKGKTKPMPDDLGISKNVWGNKLTKEEKAAKKAK